MRVYSYEEAREAGLSVVDGNGLPARETPDEIADRLARHAEWLAGDFAAALSAGGMRTAAATVFRDSLGELHVELVEFAAALRLRESISDLDPAQTAGGDAA